MKALKFVLRGKTAFFKNPEVNSYYYFTFGQIHKPVLLGIFGAIMGYNGYGIDYNTKKIKYEDYPEYYDIEETSMKKIDEEIEYSPFQMLAFCIGWMDLVLSWEDEEQKGIQETSLAIEWKWNDLGWLYQSFYNKYSNYSLNELINTFNQKVKSIIDLVNNLSVEELFEEGKRNWAKTNGKEFSVCRLIHLNTIANFKNFRGKIRKWKKNNK